MNITPGETPGSPTGQKGHPMNLTSHATHISRTVLDNYIWNVKLYMMKHYGCNTADREIDPLVWYINTGRASVQFLGRMIERKPYMIGRLLHKGGSVDEAINRLHEFVGA